MTQPFVSALCISGKDDFVDTIFLPNAIESFLIQDWPPDRRELVIVNHNPNKPNLDSFYQRARNLGTTIKLVHTTNRRSLGHLRNLSEQAAAGEFMITWDCDDWHHPSRLSIQVQACIRHPGHASFLKRRLGYSFTTDTAWIREWQHMPLHGSLCHPRECLDCPGAIRYPDSNLSEDTTVFRAWADRGAVVCDNDPAIYIQFEHGHNSWDRRHILREFDSPWGLGQWHIGDRHRDYLRSVLARYPVTLSTHQPNHGPPADT